MVLTFLCSKKKFLGLWPHKTFAAKEKTEITGQFGSGTHLEILVVPGVATLGPITAGVPVARAYQLEFAIGCAA